MPLLYKLVIFVNLSKLNNHFITSNIAQLGVDQLCNIHV
jgi:hypothetical protein